MLFTASKYIIKNIALFFIPLLCFVCLAKSSAIEHVEKKQILELFTIAQDKTLISSTNTLEKHYALLNLDPFKCKDGFFILDKANFQKNINLYPIKKLLNLWQDYEQYLLEQSFLCILEGTILAKTVRNAISKNTILNDIHLYYQTKNYPIGKMPSNPDTSPLNEQDLWLSISKLQETDFNEGGASGGPLVSGWALHVGNLIIKLKNIDEYVNLDQEVEALLIKFTKQITEKYHEKNLLPVFHSAKDTTSTILNVLTAIAKKHQPLFFKPTCLDLSYLSFADLLFNYERDFYTIDKHNDPGDTRAEGWNVKMQIAAIFIAILNPFFHSKHKNAPNDTFYNESFDLKEFENIKTVILDYTNITTLDLRFWVNLFPNVETISVVGCTLNPLSSADKLFLAGHNAYGYGNKGKLNIRIDKTQIDIVKPTCWNFALMFLQDLFGKKSTKVDMYKEDESKKSTSIIYANKKLPYFLSTKLIGLSMFFNYPIWLAIIWNIATNFYFRYFTPGLIAQKYCLSVNPAFGGIFGLSNKNELWKTHLMLWLPVYFFCMLQLMRICFKYLDSSALTRQYIALITQVFFTDRELKKLTNDTFHSIVMQYNIFVHVFIPTIVFVKSINYKAFIHLFTNEYDINEKYTIVDDPL